MLGAIIGDVIGSRFEFKNHKTTDLYDFDLFSPECKTTDDSVLSYAVAKTLLDGSRDYKGNLASFGNSYLKKGYGAKFKDWLASTDKQPYQSFGNGSAMRVSACGWWFDTLKATLAEAVRSAMPTHDHSEGLKGAQAIAGAIFLARSGYTCQEIKNYIEMTFDYDLGRTIDEIRPNYKFEVSCQRSVPEALICALDAKDYEHAIRRSVSLGGDSDTISCIAGSVAEALFGLPTPIVVNAMDFIEPEFMKINTAFIEAMKARPQPKWRNSL